MSQKKVWLYPKVRYHLVTGSMSFVLAIVGVLTIPMDDIAGIFLAYTVFALGMIASVMYLTGCIASRKVEAEINNLLIANGYNHPHQCQIHLSYNHDKVGMIEYNDRCYYLMGDDISRINVSEQSISKNNLWFIEITFSSVGHDPKTIGIVADRLNSREYVYKK